MSPHAGLLLSAYAAAPALDGWNRGQEAQFLSGAAALPHVGGLEIPFYSSGMLHKYDGDWFVGQVRHLPGHFSYVITTIPDTMDHLGSFPAFGLASNVAAGREAALARAAAAADAVRRLNGALGRKAVRAVHLYSAPRVGAPARGRDGPAASGETLAESLKEVSEYDWDGARPVLEHCDTAGPHHPPVKGFLPVDAEVEAVLRADTGVGVAVNWARSVLESRDTGAPERHVELALQAGVLAGVVLSGCSPEPTAFGAAWDDVHLPPASVEPASMLTAGAIGSVAGALADCTAVKEPYRGLKISAPKGSSVEQRVSLMARSIDAVRGAGF